MEGRSHVRSPARQHPGTGEIERWAPCPTTRVWVTARVSRLRRVALAGVVLGLARCNSDSRSLSTPIGPTSSVASVLVGGWLSPLARGESVQLSATAIAVTGSSRSVTTEAAWQSSNATVAVVSQTGLVTALAGGTAEIRATFADRTGTLSVSVEGGGDPGGPLPGLACGVERWPVKTLSDPDATRVDLGDRSSDDHQGAERAHAALQRTPECKDVRRRVPGLRSSGAHHLRAARGGPGLPHRARRSFGR